MSPALEGLQWDSPTPPGSCGNTPVKFGVNTLVGSDPPEDKSLLRLRRPVLVWERLYIWFKIKYSL